MDEHRGPLYRLRQRLPQGFLRIAIVTLVASAALAAAGYMYGHQHDTATAPAQVSVQDIPPSANGDEIAVPSQLELSSD